MIFKNKVKQVISLFLSFTFILDSTLNASVAITAEQRPVDMGTFLRDSDRPSDLPVAAYSDFFEKENINIVENMDLSNYEGMKAFIGYGVYDISEEQCQYLEVPGKGQFEFDHEFEKYGAHNGHTYGISRNTMDYNSCIALAGEYGGAPVSIDNSAENYYLDSTFATTSAGKIWVGATIDSCSDSSYTSGINRTQFFTNWATATVANTCDENKKNVIMNSTGTWEKVNSGTYGKCLVEWTSDTKYRPIRVCAPWWKINREYKNENMGLYNEDELRRINQADLPINLNICIKYDPVAAEAAEKPRRDVTCTSYYSRNAAPECARDMYQDQCYVDECQGYLKNVCRHKSEEVVGKGYVKGQIMSGGTKVSVKVKDEVTTHVYDCPPSPPSIKNCLDSAKVMIWPKECPGSSCYSLKECYLAAKNKTETEACESQYHCEKIYASRDIPPRIDPVSGNVVELYGICSDGTQLSFLPNILNKNNKVCEEYEIYTVTEQIKQKCTVERPVNNYHVNVAFTEDDIYQDDPNCIRTDKVEDSQKLSEITINLDLKGYFQNRITKVNLDDSKDLVFAGGTDSFLLASVLSAPISYTSENSQTTTTETCDIDLQCDIFDDKNTVMAFLDRTKAIVNDGEAKDNNIDSLDLNTHKLTIFGLSKEECEGGTDISGTLYESYPVAHGFDTYSTSVTSVLNETTGNRTCYINFKSETIDDYLDLVKTLDGTQLVYEFTNDMTKDKCLRKAICIGGTFNENLFGSDYLSTGHCSIVSGEYPQSYMDYVKAEAGCVNTPLEPVSEDICTPYSTSGSAFSSINGFESILVFEDFLTGPWGYYSNFVQKLPKQNKIILTTANYTDQEVYPLIEISTIKDYQHFVEEIYHEAHLAANPDYEAGAAVAAAGAAVVWAATYGPIFAVIGSTGIGVIVVLVIIIVLMVMSRPKKMNRQDIDWIVFKHIDPDQYHSIFEKRVFIDKDYQVGVHNPSFYLIPGNDQNWFYITDRTYTGRIEPGDFNQKNAANLNTKENLFKCGGWDNANFNLAVHPSERGIITGYPSCPWYNPWCEKMDAYNWTLDQTLSKNVNTIYYGADQSLVVLLPYRGDFTFEAYDKYDNLLSKVDIQENSFINTFSTDSLKFAQVKFGPGMELAEGVRQDLSCVSDIMVEWGGGVSGAYHENKTTGINSNCAKSNDSYVEDHAMTKIKIIPKNIENEAFEYTLVKPLPFSNRVYAATLDKLQDRFYRCFGEFPECSDDEYSEEQ